MISRVGPLTVPPCQRLRGLAMASRAQRQRPSHRCQPMTRPSRLQAVDEQRLRSRIGVMSLPGKLLATAALAASAASFAAPARAAPIAAPSSLQGAMAPLTEAVQWWGWGPDPYYGYYAPGYVYGGCGGGTRVALRLPPAMPQAIKPVPPTSRDVWSASAPTIRPRAPISAATAAAIPVRNLSSGCFQFRQATPGCRRGARAVRRCRARAAPCARRQASCRTGE
jgi:hypothetical protein